MNLPFEKEAGCVYIIESTLEYATHDTPNELICTNNA